MTATHKKYQLSMKGTEKKHIIITHGTLAYRLWHPFHQPSSQNKRHTKYSLFHNPQRPATKHGTWNPASSQEKHFNHPNVGSLFTAPRRIGSRVRLIDQSKNDLRDDGIRDGG